MRDGKIIKFWTKPLGSGGCSVHNNSRSQSQVLSFVSRQRTDTGILKRRKFLWYLQSVSPDDALWHCTSLLFPFPHAPSYSLSRISGRRKVKRRGWAKSSIRTLDTDQTSKEEAVTAGCEEDGNNSTCSVTFRSIISAWGQLDQMSAKQASPQDLLHRILITPWSCTEIERVVLLTLSLPIIPPSSINGIGYAVSPIMIKINLGYQTTNGDSPMTKDSNCSNDCKNRSRCFIISLLHPVTAMTMLCGMMAGSVWKRWRNVWMMPIPNTER